mgnify:FL=1
MELRIVFIITLLLSLTSFERKKEANNDGLYILLQVNKLKSNEIFCDTAFLVISISNQSFQSILISKNMKCFASTRKNAQIFFNDSTSTTIFWNARGNQIDEKLLTSETVDIIRKIWCLDGVNYKRDESGLIFFTNSYSFYLKKIGKPKNILLYYNIKRNIFKGLK